MLDELGLPEVPESPVFDEPAVALLPDVPEVPGLVEPVAPMLPDAEPDVEDGELEAELPGAVVSLLLVVLDGVVLELDDGEEDVPDDAPVAALPGCLSQPVTAAPAKARTATTGMSFFMTSPINV